MLFEIGIFLGGAGIFLIGAAVMFVVVPLRGELQEELSQKQRAAGR